MKRLFLFLSFLILNIVAALAQHITANAPQQVATGQQFRLQYSIDTQDISDFSMGQVPDAFEVLMGPSRSTSSSFQIINGKTSQSSSTTLTYILVANKNGTFTLPSASVTADGRKISSNTVKIVVSGQAQGQNNGGGSGSGNSRQHRDAQEQDMGKNISGMSCSFVSAPTRSASMSRSLSYSLTRSIRSLTSPSLRVRCPT